MRPTLLRFAVVGSLAISLCMGCMGCVEDQPPHFWRLPPTRSGGGLFYVSGRHSYLVAHGHLYEFVPPDDDSYGDGLAADRLGVWQEVPVPEVPIFDVTEPTAAAP